jgi:hypothetical protein
MVRTPSSASLDIFLADATGISAVRLQMVGKFQNVNVGDVVTARTGLLLLRGQLLFFFRGTPTDGQVA